jgi:hypothetical protein
MKKSHKRIIDKLHQGWRLDPDEHSFKWYDLIPPSQLYRHPALRRGVERVRMATIEEMRRLELLKIDHSGSVATLVAFDM